MDPSEYCILVAEDNTILRYVTSKTLSEQRYCVLEAGDAREALQELLERPLVKNLDDPVFGGGLPEVDADLRYRVEYAGKATDSPMPSSIRRTNSAVMVSANPENRVAADQIR